MYVSFIYNETNFMRFIIYIIIYTVKNKIYEMCIHIYLSIYSIYIYIYMYITTCILYNSQILFNTLKWISSPSWFITLKGYGATYNTKIIANYTYSKEKVKIMWREKVVHVHEREEKDTIIHMPLYIPCLSSLYLSILSDTPIYIIHPVTRTNVLISHMCKPV